MYRPFLPGNHIPHTSFYTSGEVISVLIPFCLHNFFPLQTESHQSRAVSNSRQGEFLSRWLTRIKKRGITARKPESCRSPTHSFIPPYFNSTLNLNTSGRESVCLDFRRESETRISKSLSLCSFTLKNGLRLCADPGDHWVQKCVEKLDQRMTD